MALNNGKNQNHLRSFFFFFLAVLHVGSFLTRDRTHTPCIESIES